ncbi:MAG: nucleoside deaminase [Bacteroidota bacterium]
METSNEAISLCAQLAWASFAEGNVGIGCVLLNSEGSVISKGRNQSLQDNPNATDFSRSAIAHAEMDALRKVRVPEIRGGTMVASLQPCDMCVGASVLADISNVLFLAEDPYWAAAQGYDHFQYFVDERYSVLCALLPLITFSERWSFEQCGKFNTRYPKLFEIALRYAKNDALRRFAMYETNAELGIDRLFSEIDREEFLEELQKSTA